MPHNPMRKRSFVKADKGMLLGYARVSKGDEQSNKTQAKALRAADCRRIFGEAASGGRWDRPELHRMLDQLSGGRCRRRVEAGSPFAVAQGRSAYHGADRRRWRRLPLD